MYGIAHASASPYAPTVLPGLGLGSALTPSVSASRNEIDVGLRAGGDGKLVVTSSPPSGLDLYANFTSALYGSAAVAANNLLRPPGPLSATSSVGLGGGTATIGTVPTFGDQAVVWTQGSWTLVVEGASQAQDLATAQQMVTYFAANPLPAGPGLYWMLYGKAGDVSTINWVHGTSTILVDGESSDPTRAPELAAGTRLWPTGAAG
jgi:hypothetical protein